MPTLHAAARDGRLVDLAAELQIKQAEGTLATGTPDPTPALHPPA